MSMLGLDQSESQRPSCPLAASNSNRLNVRWWSLYHVEVKETMQEVPLPEAIPQKLAERPITLLAPGRFIYYSEISHLLPEQRRGVACDFYIEGIEKDDQDGQTEKRSFGHIKGRITNVDHHSPIPEFCRRVSSGNLALRYVAEMGVVAAEDPVFINHTDCDSILSSAIVRGILPPLPEFGEAVIAADHTGSPNPIADLLQALDSHKSVATSLKWLCAYMHGMPLDEPTRCRVAGRQAERQSIASLVGAGRFQPIGSGVVVCVLQEGDMNAELTVSQLPEAVAIVVGAPRLGGKWTIRTRLGLAAPPGLTFNEIAPDKFVDPLWGGRWNAGANQRGGGTVMHPVEWAGRLATRIEQMLQPQATAAHV
ncbi:hypothetical protein PAPYR_719 [Paratrimastix pyriformis]|uniref:Uncharacterized protein n=1 Tax=Paratrimastix pyriformis TaxID=342808 RepID=A0ABQ8UY64_9EUKA|nr:hypothetical protein PAPYR_719 [Paratrimastix pyriformis]